MVADSNFVLAKVPEPRVPRVEVEKELSQRLLLPRPEVLGLQASCRVLGAPMTRFIYLCNGLGVRQRSLLQGRKKQI